MRMKVFGWLIVGSILYVCPNAMGQQTIFSNEIIGSNPGQTVAGVNSGGTPWVVTSASVTISADGRVRARIRGLNITGTGSTGPVNGVAASLVCGGSGGTVAATTASFPLSSGGNAKISDIIKLPSSCIAPVILIRVTSTASGPLAAPGPFIALSGFNTAGTDESTDSAPAAPDGSNDH